MVKMDASAAIRQYIPTRPREGRVQLVPVGSAADMVLMGCSSFRPHSYFQSGSSGCLMSHRGRGLLTSGSAAKLYKGGGEATLHSSVHASHGSLPAVFPRKYDQIKLKTKHKIA